MCEAFASVLFTSVTSCSHSSSTLRGPVGSGPRYFALFYFARRDVINFAVKPKQQSHDIGACASFRKAPTITTPDWNHYRKKPRSKRWIRNRIFFRNSNLDLWDGTQEAMNHRLEESVSRARGAKTRKKSAPSDTRSLNPAGIDPIKAETMRTTTTTPTRTIQQECEKQRRPRPPPSRHPTDVALRDLCRSKIIYVSFLDWRNVYFITINQWRY